MQPGAYEFCIGPIFSSLIHLNKDFFQKPIENVHICKCTFEVPYGFDCNSVWLEGGMGLGRY